MLCSVTIGVPLLQALLHDLSKLYPSEFLPYAKHFYGADGQRLPIRDSSGAYDPNSQPDSFKRAWLSHQRNLHHWQAWISIGDNGSLSAIRMPDRYVLEMVADWCGAGMAISCEKNPSKWYACNKGKMVLHPYTRAYVERVLERLV
jgi:hypothetical protein